MVVVVVAGVGLGGGGGGGAGDFRAVPKAERIETWARRGGGFDFLAAGFGGGIGRAVALMR